MTSHPSTSSNPSSSGSGFAGIVGRTEPRLWTPPLRELTEETSFGYEVIEFAKFIGRPLDPWQEWLVIHAGELLEDGRPRFRLVLVLVSRQNGKTELLVILTLWWMWVERVPLVLGTSTKLDYAAESWKKACRLARRHPILSREIDPRRGIRRANGEQELWRADTVERITEEGSRYKIAASNEDGGRSLTVHRLVLDELRQHHDYSAFNAAVPATTAVPDAQVWMITNQGGDDSVVLHDHRSAALKYMKTGEGDPRLGLFEWSAPEDSSPLDIDALAQANPNLGRRIDPQSLIGQAVTAVEKGGEALAGFKTEYMCMRVPKLDPAVDPEGWELGLVDGDLSAVRDRIALCVDLAPDGMHATLVAAAIVPPPAAEAGRSAGPAEQPADVVTAPELYVRVEVVAAWAGPTCTRDLRRELPAWVRKVRPRVLGWFPAGPAAAIAADLADPNRKGRGPRAPWPPAGVKVEEIRSEITAVCMGFAELARLGGVLHVNDALLEAHILGVERLYRGDAWVFTRKGSGSADAAYAAAGAVHLARTLPPSPGKPRIIVPRDSR